MKHEIPRRAILGGMLAAVPAAALSKRGIAAAADSGSSRGSGGKIVGIMQEALDSKLFAGAVLAVSRRGETVLERAFGLANIELNVPVSAKTVFRVGSITKQFTAAAILLLRDRGLLSLDDTLSKFLPDFPRSNEVTLRQLLTHTSGVHNYVIGTVVAGGTNQDLSISRSTEEMVRYIAAQPRLYDFDPGTSCAYSNSGYYLLHAIIEKVSSTSLQAFLDRSFFRPLGLSETSLDDLLTIIPNRASGYDAAPDTPYGFTNATFIDPSAAGGAGALLSTAGDLLKWHEALFGGKCLSARSLKEMLEPARMKNGRLTGETREPWPPLGAFEFGLGQQLYSIGGATLVGHGGTISGFNAQLIRIVEKETSIAVLTNTWGAHTWGGADRVIKPIVDALL